MLDWLDSKFKLQIIFKRKIKIKDLVTWLICEGWLNQMQMIYFVWPKEGKDIGLFLQCINIKHVHVLTTTVLCFPKIAMFSNLQSLW